MTIIQRHKPETEAAQRDALERMGELDWVLKSDVAKTTKVVVAYEQTGRITAIFDLRDCYKKRAPLKGITKAVRRAVQPRRKKHARSRR